MARTTITRLAGAACALLLSTLVAEPVWAQQAAPAITVAPIILVEPMVETPVPIQVAGANALPRTSFLKIKGLPAQAKLSDGHFVSAGTWALPIASLPDLKLTVPLATSGRTELHLSLMSIEGAVLAEAKATLAVTAGQIGSIAAQPTPQPVPQPINQLPSTAALAPEPPAPAPAPAPTLVRPPAPAPSRAAPPPPAAPALSPAEQERAVKLLRRGDSELAGGDVAAARLLYQRAAEAGLGEAALALGGTFDPVELARRGVQGLQGEPETARKWYAKAQELGVAGAAERLSRLGR